MSAVESAYTWSKYAFADNWFDGFSSVYSAIKTAIRRTHGEREKKDEDVAIHLPRVYGFLPAVGP